MKVVIGDADGEPVDVVQNPEDFDLDDYLHRGRLRGYLERAVKDYGGRVIIVATEEGDVFRQFDVTAETFDDVHAHAPLMAQLNDAIRTLGSYAEAA